MKSEGEFTKRVVESWIVGDKQNMIKRSDNLQIEGKFEENPTRKWLPGERAKVVKQIDNLKINENGKEHFTKRSQDIWKFGERAKIVKHADNLKMQGKFESKVNEKWTPGDRASSIRQMDNLYVEGSVDYSKRTMATAGERTSVVKHADNLQVGGNFVKREAHSLNSADVGKKLPYIRRRDNLSQQGEFYENRINRQQLLKGGSKLTKANLSETKKNEDHLKIESHLTGKAKDISTEEGKIENREFASKAVTSRKASEITNQDSLKLEGSLDMKRRGTITLRTEKENTRKTEDNLKAEGSSEKRIQVKSFDSNCFENNESQFSSTSNLTQMTGFKSNTSSGIKDSIHQSGKEEASISAVNRDKFASSLRESKGVILGQQKEMSVIENHRKQSLQRQKFESWDSRVTGYSVGEAHAHTGRTAAYGGQDYEYSGSVASRSANTNAPNRAVRQANTVGLSAGFKNEQISGYARNLGNSHSGSALIRPDQVVRHEASTSRQEMSSSAYQSVTQQSYKAHQTSDRTTPSRRRTWAESSLMYGGAVTIGQSIYAQDFHQHSCPASKVYSSTSPYKYERQSSSGHKMFAARENL